MIDKLKEKTGLEIKEDELLKNHTTFRIGGPAKYLVAVNNLEIL